jgi:hypothetical protein
MATARRATKLTMMATGGDDDDDGDGATGYDDYGDDTMAVECSLKQHRHDR